MLPDTRLGDGDALEQTDLYSCSSSSWEEIEGVGTPLISLGLSLLPEQIREVGPEIKHLQNLGNSFDNACVF